ncbi:MAG: hypothetical protein R2699_10350 [Acidimicrobiales bacterium]
MVELHDLTLTGGAFGGSGDGGGIRVRNAPVVLVGVTLTGNAATSGGGAWVGSSGSLTLTNVTVSDNTASADRRRRDAG